MIHATIGFMQTALFAKDFLDPSGIIVRSAENLAGIVVQKLGANDLIGISMEGMPPVSSSYFNIVFRRVVEAHGPASLDRVQMVSLSPTLRQVFERSKDAARRPMADIPLTALIDSYISIIESATGGDDLDCTIEDKINVGAKMLGLLPVFKRTDRSGNVDWVPEAGEMWLVVSHPISTPGEQVRVLIYNGPGSPSRLYPFAMGGVVKMLRKLRALVTGILAQGQPTGSAAGHGVSADPVPKKPNMKR
jgi:hypothetical protein